MEKRNDYVEVESNINPYAGDKSAVEVDRTAMDAVDGGNGNGYVDVKSDIDPYESDNEESTVYDRFLYWADHVLMCLDKIDGAENVVLGCEARFISDVPDETDNLNGKIKANIYLAGLLDYVVSLTKKYDQPETLHGIWCARDSIFNALEEINGMES